MIFFFRPIDARQLSRRGANSFRVASHRLRSASKPLAASLLLVAVAGCTPAPPAAVAPAPTRSSPGQAPASAASLPSPTDRALERWWSALSKSAQTPGGAGAKTTKTGTTSIPVVAVDVAAVAARHPAWKLANALEKNRATSIRFEPISSNQGSDVRIGTPSFDVNFNAADIPSDDSGEDAPAATATSEEFFADSQSAEEQAVMAAGLEELEAAAEQDQRESITHFLQLVTERRSDWAGNYEAILKTALNEDVAAMQRTSLPPVSPLLPSADVQLEMTNLRLQLSRNIFATDQELEAARARLSELLGQWRELLRDQQQQRLLELQRLRVEEPENARSEGLQRIASDLEAIRDAQQSAQSAIAAEHRARVEQDFGNDVARLGIMLPGGTLAPEAGSPAGIREAQAVRASNPLAALGLKDKLVFVRTNSIRASSIAGIAGLPSVQAAANLNARDARIQALRTLAWREAVGQIRMASRRAGWQWRTLAQSKASEERTGVAIPDRTGEIVQMLFG